MKKDNLRFLKDEPVEDISKDWFKIHTVYAKNLLKIIRKCEPFFAIGLFGTWGIGKTTIIKLLEKLLKKANYKWLYFDVWRFSREPLKRWILFEAERQLSEQDKQFKKYTFEGRSLKSHLEYEETFKEKTEPKLDLKVLQKMWPVFRYIIYFTILLFLLSYVLPWISIKEALRPVGGVLISFAIVGVFLKVLLSEFFKEFSKTIFKRETKHITAHRAYSAEKFGSIFEDMVKKARETTPSKKLVFIFDNLDRCSDESAMETLSVIKTFLDVPGCVYIVPCDDTAIAKHIEACYAKNASKDFDARYFASEYLKKFFQVTLRIPKLPAFDRESFIDKQLEETKLTLPVEARDVITIAYGGETPRKIKRFINDFIGYYMLAQQIEEKGLIQKGEITENTPFLAKMVVMYVEWPDVLEDFANNPELLIEVSRKIRRGESLEEFKDKIKLPQKMVDFLISTHPIDLPEDIRPFLYFKRVSYDKDPELRQKVKDRFKERDAEFFKRWFTEEEEPEKAMGIINVAIDVANDWYKGERPLLMRGALEVFLKIVNQASPEFERRLINSTEKMLRFSFLREEPQKILESFREDEILEFSRLLSPNRREPFLDKYVEIFNPSYETNNRHQEIFKKLMTARELLTKPQIDKIKGWLPKRYEEEEKHIFEIINLLNDKEIKKFLDVSLPAKIMRNFNLQQNDENQLRFGAYSKIKSLADDITKEELTKKLIDAINPSRARPLDSVGKYASEIIGRLSPNDLGREGQETLFSYLKAQMDAVVVPERISWLKTLLLFKEEFNRTQQQSMEEIVSNIIKTHPNIIEVIDFLEDLDKSIINDLGSKNIKEAIKERATSIDQQNKRNFMETAKKIFKKQTWTQLFDVVDEDLDWDVESYLDLFVESYKTDINLDEAEKFLLRFLKTFVKGRSLEKENLLKRVIDLVFEDPELQKRTTLCSTLSEYILEFLKNEDFIEKGCELFDKFKDFIPTKKKAEYSKQLIEKLPSIENKAVEHKCYIDTIFVLQGSWRKNSLLGIVDFLITMLSSAKDAKFNAFGLDYLKKLEKIHPEKETKLLEEIKRIVEEPALSSTGLQVLDSWNNKGLMKELLGKIVINSSTKDKFFDEKPKKGKKGKPAVETWKHHSWVTIRDDVPWIWSTYKVTLAEAKEGCTKKFKTVFSLPKRSEVIQASIKIAVDDECLILLNGENIGTHNSKSEIKEFSLDNLKSENIIEFEVTNHRHGDEATAESNPAGLTYEIIVYTIKSSRLRR